MAISVIDARAISCPTQAKDTSVFRGAFGKSPAPRAVGRLPAWGFPAFCRLRLPCPITCELPFCWIRRAATPGGCRKASPLTEGSRGRGSTSTKSTSFAIEPQDVGKPITVRLYAKGKGELQFFFSFVKVVEGKKLPAFIGWKGRQAFFALTDEYMPYSFTMTIGCQAYAFWRYSNLVDMGYAQPLLKQLAEDKLIEPIDADIAREGQFPAFNQRFQQKVDAILGDRRAIRFESHGMDIQAGCLEKTSSEKFVILINWSGKDTAVDLGINMAARASGAAAMKKDVKYKILMRSADSTCTTHMRGQSALRARDLQQFRVPMKCGEALILYVLPAELDR